MTWRVIHADCIEAMRELGEASVDAVVCDPPYALSFMGRTWDSFRGADIDPGFLHWFAGFTDGEGCFSVHKKNVNGFETYDCQFSISLRADDRPILERIHRTLGIGTLSKTTAHRSGGSNPQARFSVSAKAELVVLRDIFRAYPLRAKKARDFELWSDALEAWLGHEPGEWSEMAEARAVLMASREYVDEGVRVDPYQMWTWRWGREALRVLKPGGHLLAFGGTRTSHRLVAGLEDAGFEIRDCLAWLYGSGFPKSLDVSKAIDKAAGAARTERTGLPYEVPNARAVNPHFIQIAEQRESDEPKTIEYAPTAPATPDAERWQGWGTALKPAFEPIVLARKPLSGTVAANVLEYGTGALNVDGARIEHDAASAAWVERWAGDEGHPTRPGWGNRGAVFGGSSLGRWPANVILDAEAASAMPGGAHRFFATFDPCGDGSTEAGSTPDGASLEAGRLGNGSTTAGSGSRPTARSHQASMFTTETTTDSTTSSTTSSSLSEASTSTTTEPSGPPESNRTESAGAPAAASGSLSPSSPPDPTDRARRTADPVGGTTSASGDGSVGSRAFYTAKTSRSERERGVREYLPDKDEAALNWSSGEQSPGTFQAEGTNRAARNHHPTVKPVDLMQWLCRLITPPGGLILDPFLGSGSTGIAALREGFDFIGIEREAEYVEIARARIIGDAPLFNVEEVTAEATSS